MSTPHCGFDALNHASISAACECVFAERTFEAKLVNLGFSAPESVSISPALLDKIVGRIAMTICIYCMRSKRARRFLVDAILLSMLEEFDGLMIFPEDICVSSLFKSRGPVDFLVGSRTCDHEHAVVQVFAVMCKLSMYGFQSHFPQWLGELSAVANGGDFSQGALTDGYHWIFATLTREDAPFDASAALRLEFRPKPKLVLTTSRCLSGTWSDGVSNCTNYWRCMVNHDSFSTHT